MSRSSSSLIDPTAVRALCSRISRRPEPVRSVIVREDRADAIRFPLHVAEPVRHEPGLVSAGFVPTPVEADGSSGSSEPTQAHSSPAHQDAMSSESYELLGVVIEELARALVDTTHYTPQEQLLELLDQVRQLLDARDVFLADQVGLPITSSSSNEESIVFAAALLAELNRWRPMNVFDGALTVVECSPSEFLTLLFVRGQVETFILGVMTQGALASEVMGALSVALGAVQSH